MKKKKKTHKFQWKYFNYDVPRLLILKRSLLEGLTISMDSPETKEEEEEEEEEEVEEKKKTKKGFLYILIRCVLVFSFLSLATLFLSFLVLLLAVCLGNLSIWNPISVPSQCKIVASSKYSVYSLFNFLFFFFWARSGCSRYCVNINEHF